MIRSGMGVGQSRILSLVLLAVVGISCFFLFQRDSAPAPEPWKKLRRGMTKQEVVAAIGESGRSHGPSTSVVVSLSFYRKECWEYYSKQWFALWTPADDSYVVYFSADGRVASLRKPKSP